MPEYENNRSNSEFLELVFTKMNFKLLKVIELMNIKKRNYLETKELFETKSNMIEIFYQLSLGTTNKELENTYLYLSELLSTTELKNIQIVLDFCNNTRKKIKN
jgi:nitric oxide reductase activation protein